ncbi:MAG: translation initiation factor IF-2 [Firmicutes bacterium]|nr:translation initiation factor IF-2 [Bacillota bacterium]
MAEKDKIRVYELAKELKLDSKRLIDLLHRLNVENIKNHMSTVDVEAVHTVRNIMQGKLPESTGHAETAAAAPKAAAESKSPSAPKTSSVSTESSTVATEHAPIAQSSPTAGTTSHRPAASSYTSRPTGNPSRPASSPRPPERAGAAPRTGTGDRPPRRDAPYGSRPSAGSSAPRSYGDNRSANGPRRPYEGSARPAGGARPSSGAPGSSGYGGAPRRSAGSAPAARSGSAASSRGPAGGGAPRSSARPTATPNAGGFAGKDANRRSAAPKNRDHRGHDQTPGRRNRGWDEMEFGSRRRPKTRKQASAHETAMPPVQRKVVLGGSILVKDLADQLGIKTTELIKRLIGLGVMAGVNQELDRDTASVVAADLGAVVEERATMEEKEELLLQGQEDRLEDLKPRPPVVTVMGHVDHGKTSLLDRIRSTRVTQSEAGGITQHIGASVIERDGRKVVFLDTPGHEAFTSMRARGAQVTDVAVLVVAANDSVMPQTIEAINHAKAANVPIVVAINKVDLPDANPEKVRSDLMQYGLVPDDWGGDVMMVPVSARTGDGIDNLLESILLQADILELKANPDRPAQGTIIEAKLDKGRGPVATVLVAKGTLHVGDIFLSGSVYGRVRALINDRGERVNEAGPSMPVEVLGFNDVPEAGDDFLAVEDERQAKTFADARSTRTKQQEESAVRGVSLDEFYQRLKDESMRELNLVIKADVHGSAEALKQSISKLGNEEVRVNILHAAVGTVTESDVMLAQASGAIIIGFNVTVESKARQVAEKEHVDIRNYRVIYDVTDDIQNALTGMLEPKYREQLMGRAEVREVFHVPKVGSVAGCYVVEGKILRSGSVRVVRDGKVIYEGSIASLRRFKDDVREVATGYECGIGIEKFNDVKVGDVFEVFVMEEIKAS